MSTFIAGVRARCNDAISRLERIRQSVGNRSFRSESRAMLQQVRKRGISDLKNKVKRKKSIWKHKFFCLAYAGQKRVPTTEDEKDELFVAGLGEKDIEFERLDLTAEEFKDVLLQAFPQLCEGGGYQLCKCIPNSRKLEPLPHRVMASPLMLRQRSGVSRTYIVPIQKDLDLTPTDCADSSVSY